MRTTRPRLAARAVVFYLLCHLFAAVQADTRGGDIWILIDTQALTLTVLQNGETRRRYDNIAVGRAGSTRDKVKRDDRTPLGRFHINRITNNSRFHRFFGIDYPNRDHAERAYRAGRLDERDYRRIVDALDEHRAPPQHTALGGHLGIHGLGAGDPGLHAAFNWTHGCVALTNEQIDELATWVRPGTRVVIR